MNSPKIQEQFDQLPDSAKKQVMDLINSFATVNDEATHRNGGFSFSWEGGLSSLKGKYTSVELQHKIDDYR